MIINANQTANEEPQVELLSITFRCRNWPELVTVQLRHSDVDLYPEPHVHTDPALAGIVEVKNYIVVPCPCPAGSHEIQVVGA